MPRPGPRTIARYSEQFKATAVQLSRLRGVQVQDVAASLYIHPFMLSRWRKEAREGGIVTKGVKLAPEVAAELKELRKLKKEHARLQMEHDILKKAIAFTSARRAKSSPSSSTVKARTRSE
jgi:transposase